MHSLIIHLILTLSRVLLHTFRADFQDFSTFFTTGRSTTIFAKDTRLDLGYMETQGTKFNLSSSCLLAFYQLRLSSQRSTSRCCNSSLESMSSIAKPRK